MYNTFTPLGVKCFTDAFDDGTIMFPHDGMIDLSYCFMFSINNRFSNHYFMFIHLSSVLESFVIAIIRFVICSFGMFVVFHAYVKKICL